MPTVKLFCGCGLANSSNTAFDHGRREFLRRQAIAAADHARHGRPPTGGDRLGQGGDDIEIERLAGRARLLRAVQNGDRSTVSGSAARKCSAENGR